VLLFLHDALVELLLHLSVLGPLLFQLRLVLSHVLRGNLLDVLQIVEQNLLCLLVTCFLVSFVDLLQVVAFLVEQGLRILHSVEHLEVLAILVRLKVQSVEQLNKTLVKLGKLNVAWTSLNLPLQDRDSTILLSKNLLLGLEFVVLVIEFSLDLHQLRVLLVFLDLGTTSFSFLELLLKTSLLLLTILLELDSLLIKSHLFLNQRRNHNNFICLNSRVSKLSVNLSLLSASNVNLFVVLLFLVVELFHISLQLRDKFGKLIPLGLLLRQTRGQLLNLVLVLLFLGLELGDDVVARVFFHLLEILH